MNTALPVLVELFDQLFANLKNMSDSNNLLRVAL